MLSEDNYDLLDYFSALSLAPSPAAVSRESGLLDAPQMGWNNNECTVVLEFKNMYLSRMAQLGDRFNVAGVVPIAQVSENGTRYCIAGTIKRLQAKRVRAFEKEYPEKYGNGEPLYDENDQLEIEDKTGKLKLNMSECSMGSRKLLRTDLPYGAQVVLQGRFKKHSNRFAARHLFLPLLAPQRPLAYGQLSRQNVPLSRKQVLVLSEPSIEQIMDVSQQLRMGFSEQVLSITALVIIGGMQMQVEAIRQISQVVDTLRDCIDVFVMPSSNADRRRMFPLQQYNGNFFPRSHSKIALCSNPQQFRAPNGLSMHLSCGENVVDFMRNCTLARDQLEALQQLLNFSHYCPTAPFSLRSEPYQKDHLVMHQMPHVMVAGKAKTFGSRVVYMQGRQVLLVAVPSGGMTLVDLQGAKARCFNSN